MGTTRQRLALVLTALLTIGGVMLSTAPTPASADGGEAMAGNPRGLADRITAGDKHTCAIGSEPGDTSGLVYCWGNNFVGQLGVGDTANRGDEPGEMDNALPLTDLGARALSLSAGTGHTCAVLVDHRLKCWGYDSSGQLGLGDTLPRGDGPGEMGTALPAVNLGTNRTAVMVTAGVEHTCALLDNGSVKCWGDNSLGQLGTGDTNDRGDQPGEMGDALPAVDLGTGRTAISISAGASHTCAVLDTHAVKCWGSAEVGQLGTGDTNHRGDQPGEMGDALPAVDLGTGVYPLAITTGRFHTCVQIDDTGVKCWGLNANGQLGTGDTTTRGDGPGEMGDALPRVETGVAMTGLAAMGFTTCVVASPADSKCWGKNDKGQLLRGDAIEEWTPTFSSIGFAVAVAGGLDHFCVLRTTGAISCGGANDSGQLGLGTTANLGDDPAEGIGVPSLDLSHTATPIAIASGTESTCFILPASELRCVGGNSFGVLGYGDTTPRGLTAQTVGNSLPPVDLGTGRTAVAVAVDDGVACAILDGGTLKCWGRNDSGNLGIGDVATRGDGPGEMGDALPAVDLGTGRTAVEVSVSQDHTCARLDNGQVKCWGDNFYGQLGQGDTSDRGDQPGEMGDNLPAVDLGTGRTAVRVVAGNLFTCALLDNAKVKCWGNGDGGKLGDGVGDFRGNAPDEMGDALPYVDLGTGRTVLDIDSSSTTCVVLDNHQVKCWGFNFNGEAGRGDTTAVGGAAGEMGDNLTPVGLGTGRTATAVRVSSGHACALLDNATMKCWGMNAMGQLGIDDSQSRGDGPGEMGDALPVVKLPASPTTFTVGDGHTCALLTTGWTKCWGWNTKGQLALGNNAWSTVGTAAGSMAAAPYSKVGGPANRVLPFVVTPGIPFGVSAVAGNTTASITWSAPRTDGGSPVVGYRIEQSVDGGQTWTVVVKGSGTTDRNATFTGLTNGIAVRYRVAAINARGASAASVASAAVVPATVPGVATGVTGTPADGRITVKWTAAPSNGAAITGYRVDRSTDNGVTWTTAIADTGSSATTALVTGLTNYVPVRFRVTASNTLGQGPTSAASAAVAPATTGFWPLTPARLADTRTGAKTVDGKFAATGLTTSGGVMAVRAVGRAGVPAGTKAVVLTVLVTKPTTAGSVAVYPCGSTRSAATTMTFAANATVSNTVVAKVGTNGNVCIWTSARTQVVVDVHGIHPSGNGYTALNPARLQSNGSIDAGKVLTVKALGRGGVPTTAKSVTLNVTVSAPAAAGKVSVYACGAARPAVPSIVFAKGATVSNMAVVRIGNGGAVCLHSSTGVKVHVDVLGAHTSTSFKAATPTRLASKAVAAKGTLTVVAAGKAGIPVGARAAVVTITVTKAAAGGSLTVYACGTSRPVTPAVVFAPNRTITQTVVASTITNGSLCVYTSAAATITVDAVGSH